jgi:hypothetical protein
MITEKIEATAELREAFLEAQALWPECSREVPPVICVWMEGDVQRAKVPAKWGSDCGRVYIVDETIPKAREILLPPDRTWDDASLGITCDEEADHMYHVDCEQGGPFTPEQVVELINQGRHYDDEFGLWLDDLEEERKQACWEAEQLANQWDHEHEARQGA